MSTEDTPVSIVLRNSAGYRMELERLEVTEVCKTLGVKETPTGDNRVQCEHMLEV
jgi:hypothetical protein